MRSVVINGVVTDHLSIMDRGLQYGDGLFETIICDHGALQLWDQHLLRMQKGAEILGIDFPGSEKYLHDIKLITENTLNDKSVIKLLLTRGQGERGYQPSRSTQPTRAVISSHLTTDSSECANHGIDVCLCHHPVSVNPALAGIKHLNRLDNVMARSEWNDEFHEGFMLDTNGYLVEGTMSNIFCIKQDKLFTPDLAQCGVNGVIRDQILSIADDRDVVPHIKHITVDEMYSMDEIFITNSVIGLWPVRRVGDTGFAIGDMTRMFESELKQRLKAHEKPIV